MYETDKNHISNYMSHVYFEAVQQFEQYLQEAQTLTFLPQKLPNFENEEDSSYSDIIEASKLNYGNNPSHLCRFCILRALHLDQITLLMGLQETPLTSLSKVIYMVVIHSTKGEDRQQWKKEIGPKVLLTVFEPFRRKEDKRTIYLIAKHDQMVVQNPKKKHESTDLIREKANELFKQRKSIEALYLYELSLAYIYDPSKRRQRAVLYTNSAACLYKLRLYHSSNRYAQLSVMIDNRYNKGYYRKIMSLFQLRRYNEIPSYLARISSLISKAQFEILNLKYTNFLANEIGIFNWRILLTEDSEMGDYLSEKLQKKGLDGQVYYFAKNDIECYELLVVNKPMVYVADSREFKESFMNLLKQLEKYYLLQKQFEKDIHQLPCKCHPTLLARQEKYMASTSDLRSITKKQFFNKMQRCLFEEKGLQNLEDCNNGYGIWREMFYFKNVCRANCTSVHINSALCVFARRKIFRGEVLELDLISDVEPTKRQENLKLKFEISCSCSLCHNEHWPQNYEGDIQGLFKLIEKFDGFKAKKQMLWFLLNGYDSEDQRLKKRALDHYYPNLIYRYMAYMQKEAEWDDVVNLMKLKSETEEEQIKKEIDKAIRKTMQDYLRIGGHEINSVYDSLMEVSWLS